jgi:hypothetical protein
MMQLTKKTLLAAFIVCFVAACVAPGPKIRTDYDHAADFSAYRTFSFVKETGTDRGGYSTLVTSYFKAAVRREMEARGYRYVDTDPDLLVNFFTDARDVTDVYSYPSASLGYGYYGYRYGLYTAWPFYDRDVETVHYKVGTANVDVVDAKKKQMIWEGVAEGRMTDAAMANPQATINATVADLFKKFPGKPAA